MTLKRMVILAAGLALTTTGAATATHLYEDPNGWITTAVSYSNPPKFTEQELSLDLFGSYIHPEEKFSHLFQTNIRHDGTWGGGVGLNYFFAKYVGIGADINMGANGGLFVDQVIGNLILRVPIESAGLAPYVFGGGGRGFDPAWQWLWDGGVGLEFRFNPVTGIFVDGRYVWTQTPSDGLYLRAGLRLVF
jgi:hypothetical protein